MRKFLLICVLVFCTMPVLPQASSAESEGVPALYYYDTTEGAFVVEAADQTDSRRITPSGHGWNGQYQNWSPSGQWFAWVGTPLHRDSQAVLISSPVLSRAIVEYADASPRGLGDYRIQWGPDDSLLISAHIKRNLTEKDKENYSYGGMVEMPKDETYEITLARPPFDFNERITWDGVRAQWSPQGRYISYYRSPLSTDEDEFPLRVMRVADQRSVSYADLYLGDDIGDLPGFSGWTPEEKLVYVTAAGTQLIIQDVETEEQEIFSVPNPNITRMDWNRAGTLALVYVLIEAKPGPQGLGRQTVWLFDRETGVWTKLQDDIEPFQGSISTRESQWRTGWSPQEHYIVYRDITQVFVYDVTAKTETLVPIPGSGKVNLFHYSPDLQWMSDESTLYMSLSDQLWQYDPVTQKATLTVPVHTREMGGSSMAYDLSPDNTLLAVSDSTQGISVIAQSDGHVESYIPPPSTSDYHEVMSIEWDSSGQWLMIDWDAAERSSFTTFVHRSGFPRHELTQNQGEPRSNWLPPQVAFDGSWGTRIINAGEPDKEFVMVPPESTWQSYRINPSAWSPGGDRMATLYDHDLVIWNTTTWTHEQSWDLHELALPDIVSGVDYLSWLDERYLWIAARKVGLFDTQTGQVEAATSVDDPTKTSGGAWCVHECTEFLVLEMARSNYGTPPLVAKDGLLWQHEGQLIERLGPSSSPSYTYNLKAHDAQTFSGAIDNANKKTSQVFLWEFGSDGRITETDLGVYAMFAPEGSTTNPDHRFYVDAQISPSGRYITLSHGPRYDDDIVSGTSTRLYDRQTKTWTQLTDTSQGLRISPQENYVFYSGRAYTGDLGKLTLFNQKDVVADSLAPASVLSWSPDETHLVTQNNSGVRFWRLDTQSNLLTEEGYYSFSYCRDNIASPISLSPDQRYVALTNCETEVAVFDLYTFEIVRHVNRVPRLMVWSPDSTWLALDTFQMLSLIHIPQPGDGERN